MRQYSIRYSTKYYGDDNASCRGDRGRLLFEGFSRSLYLTSIHRVNFAGLGDRIAAWASNWCILTRLCEIKFCVSCINVGWAEETVMKEFNLFKGNNNWTIIGYAFEEGERILTVLYVDRTHIHNRSPGNSSHLYFVETASILRNNLFDDIEFVRLERTCRPVNSLKLIKLSRDIDGVWLPLFAWQSDVINIGVLTGVACFRNRHVCAVEGICTGCGCPIYA